MVLIYSIQFHHFLFSLTTHDIFGTYQSWWTHLILFNTQTNHVLKLILSFIYTTQTPFKSTQNKNKEFNQVSVLFQGKLTSNFLIRYRWLTTF